jgi:hypothetical protein
MMSIMDLVMAPAAAVSNRVLGYLDPILYTFAIFKDIDTRDQYTSEI